MVTIGPPLESPTLWATPQSFPGQLQLGFARCPSPQITGDVLSKTTVSFCGGLRSLKRSIAQMPVPEDIMQS